MLGVNKRLQELAYLFKFQKNCDKGINIKRKEVHNGNFKILVTLENLRYQYANFEREKM